MKIPWRAILISLALLALFAWMASHMSFREVTVPAALKGDAAHNPFYAAIKLSEALNAEARWERVFTVPGEKAVIVLSTWNWSLSRTRRERIEHWVESGGRLVVDATLVGDPEGFERWAGIGTLKASKNDKDEEKTEDNVELDDSELQWSDETRAARCETWVEDGSERTFKLCDQYAENSLTSARKIQWALRDGEKIQALRTKVGLGSVTVINASPFRFREFLLGDHPQLFVASTQLHRGDSLYFFTEEEHASLVTLVWRFGAPVVLLMFAAIAISIWRATARFGPPTAPIDTARRSLAEQIRGTGQFALRFGDGMSLHAAAVRALRDAAIKRLPAYDRMPSEDRIAALAKLGNLAADDLGPALNYAGARNSQDLRHAIAVLETARRRILMKSKRSPHGN